MSDGWAFGVDIEREMERGGKQGFLAFSGAQVGICMEKGD